MYFENNCLANVSLIDKLETSLILIFVYLNKFSYSIKITLYHSLNNKYSKDIPSKVN